MDQTFESKNEMFFHGVFFQFLYVALWTEYKATVQAEDIICNHTDQVISE